MKLSMQSRVLTAAVACLVVMANVAGFRLVPAFLDRGERSVMGGELGSDLYNDIGNMEDGYIKPDNIYIERFLRPSQSKTIEKKYPYSAGDGMMLGPFQKPSEVIRAYFDIISDASNLGVKKGGCGSIGFEKAPYPEAYKLTSANFKKGMPYEKFLKSFDGIGHINLLKLVDVPAVKINGEACPRYLVEIETIEGSEIAGKTYFGYYYGYITTAQEDQGWKIESMELKPEDFLCHAYHGWWHDAGTLVDALYIKNHGVMEKILGVEEDEPYRNVIAKGKDGRQYRFLFIRLTNGADIELRHYVMVDGKWMDAKIDVPKYD